MPEHDRAAPASIALSSLGSLMSKMIFFIDSLSEENIPNISFIGTETLPADNETINVMIRIINKEKIMMIFLDNNK